MIGEDQASSTVMQLPADSGLGMEAPSAEFLATVPREFARGQLICSLGRTSPPLEAAGAIRERFAVAARTSPWALRNVAVLLGVEPLAVTRPDEEIARLVDEAYDRSERAISVAVRSSENAVPTYDLSASEENAAGVEDALRQTATASDRDLLTLDGKGPVVRLVDAILFEALSRSASDIHLQPLADRTLVRYRVDGVLYVARELPHRLAHSLISRIKVMGQMDVAERYAPQDGRATVTMGNAGGSARPSALPRSIDLRISTLPTSYGERAVIRLLDNARGTHLADFASLGMPPEVQRGLLDRANRSHGILLVTGPTGSGKTTTLYSLLRRIAGGEKGAMGSAGEPAEGSLASVRLLARAGELNVMTIEDPIEYELSTMGIAISQSQINVKKGVTFATGLRHILRQDPDVVMVGEIRDSETARIAMQASLTGHLVLSTLHTNDAASAVTRLVDLGTEAYLVAAALSAVMAQRLVRRRHADCGGRGCVACQRTGYSGRVGVFELLIVDETIRGMISRGAQLPQIREQARARGVRTLLDEGHRLVAMGVTDEAEVRRVLQGMEEGLDV